MDFYTDECSFGGGYDLPPASRKYMRKIRNMDLMDGSRKSKCQGKLNNMYGKFFEEGRFDEKNRTTTDSKYYLEKITLYEKQGATGSNMMKVLLRQHKENGGINYSKMDINNANFVDEM